jgi:predicted nuclease of predicted toxin-antitoxin system
MKVKLDENIPAGLVDVLNQYGHDTVTVPQEQLAGQPDKLIWEVAQREKRFLVTLDLDFADGRQFPPGTHEGILVLRPSRQGRKAIRALLQAVLAQQPLESFRGCLVVADERNIRLRRP